MGGVCSAPTGYSVSTPARSDCAAVYWPTLPCLPESVSQWWGKKVVGVGEQAGELWALLGRERGGTGGREEMGGGRSHISSACQILSTLFQISFPPFLSPDIHHQRVGVCPR